MGVIELLLLSIGLAMDAFAVSVCKGISMKKINCKKSCIIGLWFGGFQALMPTIGYFLGSAFESLVTNIDHWIAFILLGIIGGNMIKEAFCKEKEDEESNDDIKTIEDLYKLYKLQGLEKKEIIKKIAKDKNVAKNEIYQYFIEKKLP